MKNSLRIVFDLFIISLFICPLLVHGLHRANVDENKIMRDLTGTDTQLLAGTGFIENKGQVKGFDGSAHPEVKFVLEGDGAQIFLLNTGIAYQFSETHYPDNYSQAMRSREVDEQIELLELQQQVFTETYRMDMNLVGANNDPRISTHQRSEEYFNYYTSEALDVHHYQSITYHDVYPGIDWVIQVEGNYVKYDFVLDAGVDPSIIQIEFEDHEEIRLEGDGSLVLANRMGEIFENRPVSFQNGEEIQTEFVLDGNELSFAISNYDLDQPLVIDPEVNWSTYYGGSNLDHGVSVKSDSNGNIFMNGYTESSTAIADGGHQNNLASAPDAFLVKFNADGERQWATYYGGSQIDRSYYSDLDSEGNIYIAGQTVSTTGIGSNGHQNTYGGGSYDGFLVKFNTNGVRQWGTYYGGSVYETGYACAVDNDDNVYLVGASNSPEGIASGGYQNVVGSALNDSYLVKFNSNGQRLWATYYGGSSFENGWVCAVDNDNNVYLAGNTNSIDGIEFNGHQSENGGGLSDAFLVKFSESGSLLWATFYGGATSDSGFACTTDNQNNVILAGHTASSDNISDSGHQMDNGGVQDGFVAKFNSEGVRQWGTFYGGENFDEALNCMADTDGNIYVLGVTTSPDNIASNGFQNNYGGGNGDGFVVQFSATGDRLWGSYVGGASYDALLCVEMDPNSELLLVGLTESNADISTPGVHQGTIGGGSDAFLMGTSSVVGIETHLPHVAFSVYPNPSEEVLFIESDEFRGEFQIYAIDGRLVRSFTHNDFRTVIDISSLGSGLYNLVTIGEKGGASQKFIKR